MTEAGKQRSDRRKEKERQEREERSLIRKRLIKLIDNSETGDKEASVCKSIQNIGLFARRKKDGKCLNISISRLSKQVARGGLEAIFIRAIGLKHA